MATKKQKREKMRIHHEQRVGAWRAEGLAALEKVRLQRKKEAEEAAEKARVAKQRESLKNAQAKIVGNKRPPTREEAVEALLYLEIPVPA